MNKLLKKTLKILLPVALGGFILYWVYRDFDFARAKEVLLHGTNWGWMLFSLFFGVMSHVFRGWRWKQTLAPLGAYPKSGDCVDAIFVSYAANLILPRGAFDRYVDHHCDYRDYFSDTDACLPSFF